MRLLAGGKIMQHRFSFASIVAVLGLIAATASAEKDEPGAARQPKHCDIFPAAQKAECLECVNRQEKSHWHAVWADGKRCHADK